MPIYEYRCQPCDHTFETLVRGNGDAPHCPKCGSVEHLSKLFSVPAAAQVGGGKAGASLPICGQPSGAPFGGGCGMGGCGSGMCAMD